MTTALPLFPLRTVLFPGLVLPLRVFEDRYRALVRHLLGRPDGTPRIFGVVAIRRGYEVASLAAPVDEVTLHDMGCTAEIREVTEHPDGRFDLVTVGRLRFEIMKMIPARTLYLQAEIRYVPEPSDPDGVADRLAPRVRAAFRSYLRRVHRDADDVAEQLPEDPLVLSHLIAATTALTLADRQNLLAAPDTASRLRAELAVLQREVALLGQIRAVPVSPSELPVRPGPN